MSAEKRSFRGMFVQPRAQLIWCSALGAGFLILSIFIVTVMLGINHLLDQLRASYQIDTDTALALSGGIFFYLRMALTLSIFFAVCGVTIGIMLTHRVYGPMVPILAHVRRLLAGDYSSRATLRTNDEFKDLVSELNALAEKLQKKS